MKKEQIDRLFEIDFFHYGIKFISVTFDKMDITELNLKNPNNPELVINLVKDRLFFLKLQSLLLEENKEHLDRIIEIFKLIESSVLSKKDELIDLVIDGIDEGFSKFSKIKIKSIDQLIVEAWGYRAGVIDGIYEAIENVRDEKFSKIENAIYNEIAPGKLIEIRARLIKMFINRGVNKETDIHKIHEHIVNQLQTLRDKKEFIINTVVKEPTGFNSNLNPDKIKCLYNELKAPENACIEAKTALNDFTAIFTEQPPPVNPVKWIESNRLLSYFFTQLITLNVINCKTWQSRIEAGSFFINSTDKKITANDLAVAKTEFESYGNPKGYGKIDAILETLIG